VTSGDAWEFNAPRDETSNLGGDGGTTGSSATDQTGTGTVNLVTTAYYGPSYVLYTPAVRVPAILALGDSILGGGNSGTAIGNFMRIATKGQVSCLNAAIGGETLADLVATSARTYKVYRMMSDYGNHVVITHGTNDVYVDSVNLATLQTRHLVAWNAYTGDGRRVWQTTIAPKTTPDNSSVVANTTTRQNDNAWLRDGAPIDAITRAAVAVGATSNVLRTRYVSAPAGVISITGSVGTGHPLTGGVLEIADAVENRATGLWLSNSYHAGDGLHFSDAGFAAAADYLPVALWT
jgi:hypothetical protein